MKGTTFAAAAIVAGLVLMFVVPLAMSLLPAGAFWTDTDSAAYQKASTDLHSAAYGGAHDHSQGHEHASPQDSEGKARLRAAKAEFERQEARLKSAQSSRGWLKLGFRALGILVAIGGVWLYVKARRTASP